MGHFCTSILSDKIGFCNWMDTTSEGGEEPKDDT